MPIYKNYIFLIRFYMKLLNRYSNLLIQLIFLLAFLLLLLFYGGFGENQITVLIMVLIASTLTISYSKNMFWGGENEKILYYITSIRAKNIILAKNLTLLSLLMLYFTIILLALIIYGLDAPILLHSILFFPIVSLSFVQLCNYHFVVSSRYSGFNNPLIFIILIYIFIMVTSIPFFIIVVFWEIYSIYIIYLIAVFSLWYYISLPYTVKIFEQNNYNIFGSDYDHKI